MSLTTKVTVQLENIPKGERRYNTIAEQWSRRANEKKRMKNEKNKKEKINEVLECNIWVSRVVDPNWKSTRKSETVCPSIRRLV